MAITLDHTFLRTAEPKDVAIYLHTLALDEPHQLEAVSGQLLLAIECESLPPMVFALWTSACPDDSATVAGMQFGKSIIVRSSAIRNFRRRLRTTRCGSLWQALGGTAGITKILATFSIIHVKEFCKAVARCSTSKQAMAEREALVTDLLKALTAHTGEPGEGRRDLLGYYSKLVHTCTLDFKDAWIAERGRSGLDMARIFDRDYGRYQQECLQTISKPADGLSDDLSAYVSLFRSIPQKQNIIDSSISESMAFAVRVLEVVPTSETISKRAAWLEDTIHSLLNRILRRRSSTEFALKALRAIVRCVQQHSSDTSLDRYPSFSEKRYWRNIVRLWQYDSALYEPLLTRLLRAHKVKIDLEPNEYRKRDPSIQSCILATKHQQRYKLLQWLLANNPEHLVDIEDGEQLKKKLPRMPITILFALPNADAQRLFDRYNNVLPGKLKLSAGGLSELGDEPRIELLRLHLQDDPEAVAATARTRTLHSQQTAENSGAQPVRSAWIIASIYFAVASQSLNLLQEVVLWARRFSRDPKTVIELYGSYPEGGMPFEHEHTIELLSGIPRRFTDAKTTADISQNVRKGNEVMLDLLQSAIQAQSEPSFKPRHWENIKTLFRKAVQLRLKRVNAMQARLRLTDEQTFTCVWKDTTNVLVKAEELGLSPENKSLELVNMGGLMKMEIRERGGPVRYHPFPATLRFIDELAVLRESLWKRYRVRECPVVATLPPPWPRGLPIQAFWFLRDRDLDESGDEAADEDFDDRDVAGASGKMPFLEQRAKVVVFLSPDHALCPLPKHEETQSAIGQFADNYSLALRLHLSLGGPKQRHQRLEAAWLHATQSLSGERMTVLEREGYWYSTFKAAGAVPPSSLLKDSTLAMNKLPSPDTHATGPIEWHPGHNAISGGPKRTRLEPLIIDCFAKPVSESRWNDPEDSYSLVEKSLGEGITSNASRKWASAILGLLVLSDKPELAADLIVRIVLGTPGETPWHRILLHSGVLKRLPPSDARGVMERLADGILERLPNQPQAANGDGEDEVSAVTPGPYSPVTSTVKVTTAKMLAQILKDSTFLGEEFVVDRLVSLFSRATHIHIRAAVVNSLSRVLRSSLNSNVRTTIISTLESIVLPAAAELNERSPISEGQWDLAEKTSEPPTVYNEPGLAPICSALVDLISAQTEDLRNSLQLLERIYLPLIYKSRENHDRWMHIFLRKQNALHLATDLPTCPTKPELLRTMLEEFPSQMSATELGNLSDFIIFTGHPSEKILEFTQELKGRPQTYDQNDIQHWLQFTTGLKQDSWRENALGMKRALLTARLASEEHAVSHGLITISQLQAHEYRVLDLLLRNYSSDMEAWDNMLDSYKPQLDKGRAYKEEEVRWGEYCRPVIQHAISIVETARTPEWERDRYRDPSILPNTFKLRLWLLSYPNLYPEPERAGRIETFMKEIRAIMEEIAVSHRPYKENWTLLTETLLGCGKTYWMPLALALGGLRRQSSRAFSHRKLLCIDAADFLLNQIQRRVNSEALQEAAEMLEMWKESSDEDVRKKGIYWSKWV